MIHLPGGRLLLYAPAFAASLGASGFRLRSTPPEQPPSGANSTSTSGWDLCAAPAPRRGPHRIPRVVHFTYKNATLPWRLALFRGTWPYVMQKRWAQPGGWSERFWSDDDNRNLIAEHYPWFLETYDSYDEVISKVDAARIFYLHRYGGVYSDLDIEVLKNPAQLFNGDHELVFFYQQVPRFREKRMIEPVEEFELGYLTNALMASAPGHPFWLYLAKRMMHVHGHRPILSGKYDRRDTMIFWTTGPCMLQNALAEYQLADPGTKASFYPARYWAPYRYDSPKEAKCDFILSCRPKYPDAYFVSHWTGTWNHCEVGTCLGDNITIVTSLLQTQSKTRNKSNSDSVCY